MEKNPFSVYDFLGYVFPGSITLMIIRFIYFLHTHELLLSLYSCNLFVESLLRDFSWDDSLFFILSAYVLGHIVAYASSLTIEPYAVWRFGYPSKFMLRNNPEKEYLSVKDGMDDKKKKWVKRFKNIVKYLIFPIWTLDYWLGSKCHLNIYYVKDLDEKMVDNIVAKIDILYKKLGLHNVLTDTEIKGDDWDYHRVVYHYVYEKHEAHRGKMDNYVALYGFMRALAFIMVLVFWVSLFVILKECFNDYISYRQSFCWLLIITFFSFFFFMGFMKFYRRFTLESLMCLVTDPDLQSVSSDNSSSHVNSSQSYYCCYINNSKK